MGDIINRWNSTEKYPKQLVRIFTGGLQPTEGGYQNVVTNAQRTIQISGRQKTNSQSVKLTDAKWFLHLVISSPLIHALGDLSQALMWIPT